MALFGAKKREEIRPEPIARMGSGRHMRSNHDLALCLGTLEQVLLSYRPRKYRELSHITEPGFAWHGPAGEAPVRVVCCTDENEDFLLLPFWSNGRGADIGIFPLGSGDARLTMSIVGHWKMRDSSLQSVGTFSSGLFSLRPPVLPGDFFENILRVAGYPVTPANRRVVIDTTTSMFRVKAHQFISSKDRGAADRFIDDHQASDAALPQSILDDLARWNPGVLPYMQDLPWRCKAILLDDVGDPRSSFWADLDKRPPADSGPAVGTVPANSLSADDYAELTTWMWKSYRDGNVQPVWERRCAIGYGVGEPHMDSVSLFWFNALPALAGLRLGHRQHPVVAMCAGWAEQALDRSDEDQLATLAEINERCFGRQKT